MLSKRPPRHPPRDCPVCGARLLVTQLSCDGCGTELNGVFEPCRFCGLSGDDREVLDLFLRSRGNVKELERHLGVSYPTARARVDELLRKLELAPTPPNPQLEMLEQLASGAISVDEALDRL